VKRRGKNDSCFPYFPVLHFATFGPFRPVSFPIFFPCSQRDWHEFVTLSLLLSKRFLFTIKEIRSSLKSLNCSIWA
jgi:hypothetical protein